MRARGGTALRLGEGNKSRPLHTMPTPRLDARMPPSPVPSGRGREGAFPPRPHAVGRRAPLRSRTRTSRDVRRAWLRFLHRINKRRRRAFSAARPRAIPERHPSGWKAHALKSGPSSACGGAKAGLRVCSRQQILSNGRGAQFGGREARPAPSFPSSDLDLFASPARTGRHAAGAARVSIRAGREAQARGGFAATLLQRHPHHDDTATRHVAPRASDPPARRRPRRRAIRVPALGGAKRSSAPTSGGVLSRIRFFSRAPGVVAPRQRLACAPPPRSDAPSPHGARGGGRGGLCSSVQLFASLGNAPRASLFGIASSLDDWQDVRSSGVGSEAADARRKVAVFVGRPRGRRTARRPRVPGRRRVPRPQSNTSAAPKRACGSPPASLHAPEARASSSVRGWPGRGRTDPKAGGGAAGVGDAEVCLVGRTPGRGPNPLGALPGPDALLCSRHPPTRPNT